MFYNFFINYIAGKRALFMKDKDIPNHKKCIYSVTETNILQHGLLRGK